jgi:hypothetical protein
MNRKQRAQKQPDQEKQRPKRTKQRNLKLAQLQGAGAAAFGNNEGEPAAWTLLGQLCLAATPNDANTVCGLTHEQVLGITTAPDFQAYLGQAAREWETRSQDPDMRALLADARFRGLTDYLGGVVQQVE